MMAESGDSQATSLEQSIRNQFQTREETFQHRSVQWRILLPQSAEDLLDEEAFAKDERMPYWADLWPSARALARWLLDQPPPRGRWIELGCGVGLPSMVLQSRGADVLATDFNEDSLLFTRCNSLRNGLGELKPAILDWRKPDAKLGRADFAIAADVLYEQRNAAALANLLPQILVPTGKLILADPGRRWAPAFSRLMHGSGWVEREVCIIDEPAIGQGVASRVRISEWSRKSL